MDVHILTLHERVRNTLKPCSTLAQLMEIQLMSGDIIISGTDGLFDNVFAEEVASLVSFARNRGLARARRPRAGGLHAEQVRRHQPHVALCVCGPGAPNLKCMATSVGLSVICRFNGVCVGLNVVFTSECRVVSTRNLLSRDEEALIVPRVRKYRAPFLGGSCTKRRLSQVRLSPTGVS